MTTLRCLAAVMFYLITATTALPAMPAALSRAPVGLPSTPAPTPSHGPRHIATETPTFPPHHATPSATSSSMDTSISFADHGSRLYAPGEVAAAGFRDISGSGSTGAQPSTVFDPQATLDEILEQFANANKNNITNKNNTHHTVSPEPTAPQLDLNANATAQSDATTTPNAVGTSSSSSSRHGSGPGDVVDPDKTAGSSVFDIDPTEADKRVVPSPSVAPKPTTTTSPPKPESAFKSCAMISKICDAVFFGITFFMLALH